MLDTNMNIRLKLLNNNLSGAEVLYFPVCGDVAMFSSHSFLVFALVSKLHILDFHQMVHT